ncbi:unnamed protein product, partial [Discosporangium mesarthrocarpum]
MAMLSQDSPDEEDDEGIGAALTQLPVSALGAVVWGILSSLGRGVANASPTFVFDSYNKANYYGSTGRLLDSMVDSLGRQGIQQVYKVVGHIDILGDPLSLGKNISSGVMGFVMKAGTGHAKEGTAALLQGVVGGAAHSASKLTGALDSLVREVGALDEVTHMGMFSKVATVRHVGHGAAQGVSYFFSTVTRGVKGVVTKPMQGAKEEGALGFIKGVGKGVVGLAAAPVSGALGATSKFTSGIEATTHLLGPQSMGRRRKPR